MRWPHTSYRWRGRERRHRANQVYALSTHKLQVERGRESIEPIKCMRSPHISYRWRGERDIEPIKWMRSPHTSYRLRGERGHRANQVDALTTNQLQVERRERVIEPIKCMRSPHISYRWRGERDIEPIEWYALATHPATCGEERET